jgi:hypothetical protein
MGSFGSAQRSRTRSEKASPLIAASLTFTSVTEVDAEGHRLLVSEQHTLIDDGLERSSDYVFVMRCWTRAELDSNLRSSGFGEIAYFGAYDATIEPGSTDRLVAVAKLAKAPA